MQRNQPRLAPVGLEIGDRYKHPWGGFVIEDERGERTDDGDEREWYIRDVDTDEELWVDWDFLMEVSLANLSKMQPNK